MPHDSYDGEGLQVTDRRQAPVYEHTRLLGQQDHDSLYRTLSVRFLLQSDLYRTSS